MLHILPMTAESLVSTFRPLRSELGSLLESSVGVARTPLPQREPL